jgi:molecular chaperone GrpE (heat shock protein)
MNEEIETTPIAPSGDGQETQMQVTETETQVTDEGPGEKAISSPVTFDPPVDAEPQAEEPLESLVELGKELARLTEETARYHARAERREAVIDTMHAELEQLRRGERRSLLRPLVTEMCRTRDDLLRQADTLPEDFDRDHAADLLRNFAASLEYTLEDNGVDSFEPEVGEAFDARQHRVTGKSPIADESLVGTVESVVAPGYRDTEAGTVISAARVVVHVAQAGESGDGEPEAELRETPDPGPPDPTS